MKKRANVWGNVVLISGYLLLTGGLISTFMMVFAKEDESCSLGYCSAERLYPGLLILGVFASIIVASSFLIAVGSFITWMTDEKSLDLATIDSKLHSVNDDYETKPQQTGNETKQIRPDWWINPDEIR